MSSVYTLAFWKDAGERAISTFLQTLVSVVAIDEIFRIGFAGWKEIILAALGAAGISVVKSMIAALTGVKGTASLTTAVEPVPQSPVERLLVAVPGVRDLVQQEISRLTGIKVSAEPEQVRVNVGQGGAGGAGGSGYTSFGIPIIRPDDREPPADPFLVRPPTGLR